MSNSFVERKETSNDEMFDALDALRVAMLIRLERHGYGLAAGPHEIYGILAEEMAELLDEVRANNAPDVYNELVDIAIGAIFGMVSMTHYDEHKRGQQC